MNILSCPTCKSENVRKICTISSEEFKQLNRKTRYIIEDIREEVSKEKKVIFTAGYLYIFILILSTILTSISLEVFNFRVIMWEAIAITCFFSLILIPGQWVRYNIWKNNYKKKFICLECQKVFTEKED